EIGPLIRAERPSLGEIRRTPNVGQGGITPGGLSKRSTGKLLSTPPSTMTHARWLADRDGALPACVAASRSASVRWKALARQVSVTGSKKNGMLMDIRTADAMSRRVGSPPDSS